MHVKVREIGEGLHPSEVVVSVRTREGEENLAVSRSSLVDATLPVGWPVGQDDDHFLVELPHETFRGYWRVWVPKGDVSQGAKERRTGT